MCSATGPDLVVGEAVEACRGPGRTRRRGARARCRASGSESASDSRNSGSRCSATKSCAGASSAGSTPHASSRPIRRDATSAIASAMNAQREHRLELAVLARSRASPGSPRPRWPRGRGRRRRPGARRAARPRSGRRPSPRSAQAPRRPGRRRAPAVVDRGAPPRAIADRSRGGNATRRVRVDRAGSRTAAGRDVDGLVAGGRRRSRWWRRSCSVGVGAAACSRSQLDAAGCEPEPLLELLPSCRCTSRSCRCSLARDLGRAPGHDAPSWSVRRASACCVDLPARRRAA